MPIMATVTSSTAVVSFSSSPLRRPIRSQKAKKHVAVRCALYNLQCRESSRRLLLSTSLLLSPWILATDYATAGSLVDKLDKYVKRKKLDPLDAYVPAVILTEFQIKDLDKFLEGENPEFKSLRTLLRYGPAASLRVNIRAVAQYASDSGNGKIAFNDVDQCLSAIEDLDSLLLQASRKDPGASVKSMKAKIVIALDALDGLLKTVPEEVLDKGRTIADAYRIPEEDNGVKLDTSDPEIKRLESIL